MLDFVYSFTFEFPPSFVILFVFVSPHSSLYLYLNLHFFLYFYLLTPHSSLYLYLFLYSYLLTPHCYPAHVFCFALGINFKGALEHTFLVSGITPLKQKLRIHFLAQCSCTMVQFTEEGKFGVGAEEFFHAVHSYCTAIALLLYCIALLLH